MEIALRNQAGAVIVELFHCSSSTRPDEFGADLTPGCFTILPKLQGDGRCTSVKDAIGAKQTIGFCINGLHIDLSACIGPASEVHRPSRISQKVKLKIDSLPPIVG